MTAPAWWKNGVCYQIYPRSFADSNGDGIGDLRGILEKLDYLQWLGVNVLWISPFYPSPQFDWGYDVSDYTDIDPDYGTLADFDQLIQEAHQRGMRILLDLVLNHTSDLHVWFQQSRSSRDNPYRDWYIWQDGVNGGPPNDWESLFGGSAWQFDEQTGQYYYHYFFAEQPDLNWRNPEVKEAMFNVSRFWLDRGVDGFRLDALDTIYEDPNLRNSQIDTSLEDLFIDFRLGLADPELSALRQKIRYQHDLPEMHDLMKELRSLVDQYENRVLLGELEQPSYYGNGADELHSVFNFSLIGAMHAPRLRKVLTERLSELPQGAWECNTMSNHDRPRSFTYFSDGAQNKSRARLALALIMFLQGTPVIYYGEEIGMQDFYPQSVEQFRDQLGTWMYNALRTRRGISHTDAFEIAANKVCRDCCRTPMQWENAPNAGFSPLGIDTWLPINPDYKAGINVEEQRGNPDSMLMFLRQLVQIRQTYPAIRLGSMEILHNEGGILAFWRKTSEQSCLILLNMSAAQEEFTQNNDNLRTIFNTGRFTQGDKVGINLTLQPYEIFIAESTR